MDSASNERVVHLSRLLQVVVLLIDEVDALLTKAGFSILVDVVTEKALNRPGHTRPVGPFCNAFIA